MTKELPWKTQEDVGVARLGSNRRQRPEKKEKEGLYSALGPR